MYVGANYNALNQARLKRSPAVDGVFALGLDLTRLSAKVILGVWLHFPG